jgi:tripartite-type tricarboxylate transporter receptor subunit TctC
MTRTVDFLVASMLGWAAMSPLAAQTAYPARPIQLIVPTPAGGASDVAARTLGRAMSRALGQSIVIENKPGAGGVIAAQALMAAPADGHTLLWTLASMSGLAMLQKASPYQSLAELSPVALVGHLPYGVFVHPDVPARNIAELVEAAKARPDGYSYGTGSLADYMAMTKFMVAAGVRAVRVPYRGGVQLMPDLIGGRIQLNFGPVSNGLQHAKEGKLRLLAVLLPQRTALAPEVPTLAEAGVAGVSVPTWQAIFAPAKLPAAIAERLAREVGVALADPAMRLQLEQMALLVDPSSPQRLGKLADEATRTWQAFTRDYRIEPE